MPDVDALLEQCLTYTRSLSDLMPPVFVDNRVDRVLRELAAPMRDHGLIVDVEVPETAIVLPKNITMTVTKSVREAPVQCVETRRDSARRCPHGVRGTAISDYRP